jgi:hypothetical protein
MPQPNRFDPSQLPLMAAVWLAAIWLMFMDPKTVAAFRCVPIWWHSISGRMLISLKNFNYWPEKNCPGGHKFFSQNFLSRGQACVMRLSARGNGPPRLCTK